MNKEDIIKFIDGIPFYRCEYADFLYQKLEEKEKEIEDYKLRCEKGIEFVKKESKKCYSNKTTDDPQKVIGNFMWHTDKLLNILQGDDKDE